MSSATSSSNNDNSVELVAVSPPPPPPPQQQQNQLISTKTKQDRVAITSIDLYRTVTNLWGHRYVLMVFGALDAGVTILLLITFIIWRIEAYQIPLVDLLLYLWQVVRILTAPALVALLFDTVNFYYINIVTVLCSFSAIGDMVVFIWRAIRLAAMSSGELGRWLQTTTMLLSLIGALLCISMTICLILFSRGLKLNYNAYVLTLADMSFRQPLALFKARQRLRGLLALDLFLYIFVLLLRAVFYYNTGLWFTPYLQLPHMFLFLWVMVLSGSDERKTPLTEGGSDASTSLWLTTITLLTTAVLAIVDFSLVWATLVELLGVLGKQTIVELVAGSVVFVLCVALVAYDIVLLYGLARLSRALRQWWNDVNQSPKKTE
jgi:hypothetical protein